MHPHIRLNSKVKWILAMIYMSAAGWKVCKRNDRGKCFVDAAQQVIAAIAKHGVPKLGVFPGDPLKFDQLAIDQSNGPVNIKLDFTNLNVVGIKNAKVNDARWNDQNMILHLSIPKLVVRGQYDINGKVLILPIVGQGNCNITIEKSNVEATLMIVEGAKGKAKYFNIEKISLKIGGKRVYFNFQNLFNGDKRLGDNMNKFLNENWEIVWQEVQPAISQSFGLAIQKIANRIFSRVPSTDIAPL